jgi:hypothetical protein
MQTTNRSTAPEFFTIDEVAARFRVSRRKLQEHIRRFPYFRLFGRRKLFTETDIVRLYEALPCHSNSNRRVRVRRHTTASEAPTSESLLTEALALVNERSPTGSVAAGSTKSSAANTQTRVR